MNRLATIDEIRKKYLHNAEITKDLSDLIVNVSLLIGDELGDRLKAHFEGRDTDAKAVISLQLQVIQLMSVALKGL